VLLLLHVPPLVGSNSVAVAPTQILLAPDIGLGVGLTVTDAVVKQPAGKVYVIVAVPAAAPVTTPVPEITDATAELLLLHEPPPVASVNVVVDPTHTASVPPIDAGAGLTVNGVVTLQPAGNV